MTTPELYPSHPLGFSIHEEQKLEKKINLKICFNIFKSDSEGSITYFTEETNGKKSIEWKKEELSLVFLILRFSCKCAVTSTSARTSKTGLGMIFTNLS